MKPTRIVRTTLFGAALLAATSCADRSPLATATLGTTGTTAAVNLDGLLACAPLPYDSVTAVIGAVGGSIVVGPHRLDIPGGALAANVTITAVAPVGTVNLVRFSPEGLQFAKYATLTMSYANCGVGALLPRNIAYVSDGLAVLDLLPSSNLLLSQSVRGKLKHFSGYAVAW